jgi:hypothetical protein
MVYSCQMGLSSVHLVWSRAVVARSINLIIDGSIIPDLAHRAGILLKWCKSVCLCASLASSLSFPCQELQPPIIVIDDKLPCIGIVCE